MTPVHNPPPASITSVAVDTTSPPSSAAAGGEPPPVLPDPSVTPGGADDLPMRISILYAQTSMEDRRAARERRNAAESAIEQANRREIAALRTAAKHAHTAGMLDATFGTLSAGADCGAAFSALKQPDGERAPTQWEVASKGIHATDELSAAISGRYEHLSQQANTDAKQAEHAAAAAERAYDRACDEVGESREDFNRALDLIGQMYDAKQQSQKAAVRG